MVKSPDTYLFTNEVHLNFIDKVVLFCLFIAAVVFWFGFTPCKAEQSLCMELQEKETQKD